MAVRGRKSYYGHYDMIAQLNANTGNAPGPAGAALETDVVTVDMS